MSELKLAAGLALPDDFVTKTCAILAQRRKGKTYTGSVLAEEFVRVRIPFVALDPTGAWWGLRASADGESAGLPVVVIGGKHGDAPLERQAGRVVADLVLDHPGYYVLDLSLLESRAAEREFAADFGQHLHRRKMQPGMDFPLHLFVDEADLFVPQEKEGRGDLAVLGAYQGIIRRGGLHGLGATLISQRPALVNKSVLTQLDILILLRLVSGNDQDAVDKNYISRSSTKEQRAELMGSLASLPVGEAWVFEPGAEPEPLFGRYKIRERRTYNSSATPKAGEKRVEPRVLADVDLAALEERMASAVERQKADDPAELRKRIVTLERELAQRPTEVEERVVVSEVEVPVFAAEDWVRVEGNVDALRSIGERLENLVGEQREALAEFAGKILAGQSGEGRAERSRAAVGPETVRAAVVSEDAATTGAGAASEPTVSRDLSAVSSSNGDGGLGTSARKILETIVRHRPARLTASQIAQLSGRKARGGSWNTAIRQLRDGGYIGPGSDLFVATDLGAAAVGGAPLYGISPSDLLESWRAALPTASLELFDLLLDSHPNAVPPDVLAARAGRQPRGGSWNTAIATLVRNDLIEKTGDGLRANHDLATSRRAS